jgi:hypothetical protein
MSTPPAADRFVLVAAGLEEELRLCPIEERRAPGDRLMSREPRR